MFNQIRKWAGIVYDRNDLTGSYIKHQRRAEDFLGESQNLTYQSRLEAMSLLVKQLDPTVLCLQEASQFVDADGVTHSLLDEIKEAGNYPSAYFGKIVSMETHLQCQERCDGQGHLQ